MKILLIDDHTSFRNEITPVLRRLDHEVEILEVYSCAQMRAAARDNPDIDLVLLDPSLPDGDGLTVLEQCELSPVIVLSNSQKIEEMQRAFNMGVLGFMPKTITGTVLLIALKMILLASETRQSPTTTERPKTMRRPKAADSAPIVLH